MKVFSSGEILALLHPGLDFIRELAAPVEVGSSPSISHRSWLFSSRTLIELPFALIIGLFFAGRERSNFSVRNQATGRPSLMAVEQLARGAQPRCQCPFCSRVFAIFCHSSSTSTLKWLDHCLRVRLRNSGFEYREGPNPPRIIDSSLLIQGRSDAKNCFLSYPFTRKKGLKQCVHGHSEHRIFGIKERVGQVREGRAG
ncbi:hypothetical protein L195_g008020 [Trifolium pratense]|uniref:Uncharacterized protein n=1 Tax=Trifolium pratense TaxID=57577 RepID=A0A2K3P803_TRIPR|nr:hypothetical protein L195_g008020 [Trifolium pratense]